MLGIDVGYNHYWWWMNNVIQQWLYQDDSTEILMGVREFDHKKNGILRDIDGFPLRWMEGVPTSKMGSQLELRMDFPKHMIGEKNGGPKTEFLEIFYFIIWNHWEILEILFGGMT